MSRTDVIIFIMGAIAIFLLIGYFGQYRTATKIRKETAEANEKQKERRPLYHMRLARFDHIIFDVLSKRRCMSKEDHSFLVESIPILYTGEAEIRETTEYVDSLYDRYG